MKKSWVYAFIVSALIGGTAFLSSGHYLIGIAVGLCCFVAALGYVLPVCSEFARKSRKRHECYLFIHGYLITLSVCMSLDKAFEVATQSMGKEFHVLDETLSSMQARERTEYLVAYFESDIYKMFLSILHLYLDRGGDVLKLSSELTAESARIEETEQSYEKQAVRKGVSFFFLWLMAIVIVVFLRFGLSSFFASMQQSPLYLGALALFYLFFVASTIIYLNFHTGVKPSYLKRRTAR